MQTIKSIAFYTINIALWAILVLVTYSEWRDIHLGVRDPSFVVIPAIAFAVVYLPIIGVLGVFKLLGNTNRLGLKTPGHALSKLRLGDRNSLIIEERVSGWFTLIAARLSGLGSALGLAAFPPVTANFYGYDGSIFPLLGASLICLVGTVVVALALGNDERSGGCLSFIFTIIVVAVAMSLVEVDIPQDSNAWKFLLFGLIVAGTFGANVISIPTAFFCAMLPAFRGELKTADGRSFGIIRSAYVFICFCFIAPIYTIVLLKDAFAQHNQSNRTDPTSPSGAES